MSYYSDPLYKDVARNWKGYGLAYLVLLLALCLAPEMVRLQGDISDVLASEAPGFVSQVPVISISKGQVSMDKPSPYFITYPDKSKTFAIIDTSGKYTSLGNDGTAVLLTGTKLLVRRTPDDDVNVFDLAGIDHLIIDQKQVYAWIRLIRDWSAFVLYPVTLLFTFLYQMTQVLLCAAIGTLFAKRFRTDLGYKPLIRLSAVAYTPAMILQALHALLGIGFPYGPSITFLITAGYLYHAVGVVSEKETAEAVKY